ncbi:MAG: YdeI/OmpD-associated family protein [Candidatus Coatesbacteria bacterium]|nr:YdeI/OmpD-associated family protein [Candidatus Coatesbacteria bacterium]
MRILDCIHVSDRNEWENWLAGNSDNKKEIWLIFYKKSSLKTSISYSDALDVALCYGWIDSIIKRLDDEKYLRKFTVRKNRSKWSVANIKRVKKLISEGRMREEGMKVFDKKLLNIDLKESPKKTMPEEPPDLMEVLSSNEKALKFYLKLTPSNKRNYINWINDAKKEETRKRRIKKFFSMLKRNEKPGMI